jgi:hypothetical protein
MSNDLRFDRVAPNPSQSGLSGKMFLGRIRTMSTVYRTDDGPTIIFDDGIDLYDSNAMDLSNPFMTVMQGQVINLVAGLGSVDFHGMPATNLFCFITFDPLGIRMDCEGITAAWFFPQGSGDSMSWVMKAIGGIAIQLNGPCPFMPPLGIAAPDLWQGATQPPFPGFSPTAPMLAVQTPEVALASIFGGVGAWQAELQVCDLDGNDDNLDSGNGPASPWNTLTRNCCKNGSSVDDQTGDGDDEPPEQKDCVGAITCKIVCRRVGVGGGGLGGNPTNVWCYPKENGRYTNYCETDIHVVTCMCSATDIAGNQVPNANTVPVGTVLFVKCIPGGGLFGYKGCDFYNVIG